MNQTQRHRFYYMESKHRLFIVSGAFIRLELARLCRKQIRSVDSAWVTHRRQHDPFAEEIDLTVGVAANIQAEEIVAA